VELGPLLHKSSGARGQLAVQRIARGDSDTRSVFRVPRMEVRRVVIVEEHRYHDAIEGADRRQELESKVASGQSVDQLAQDDLSSFTGATGSGLFVAVRDGARDAISWIREVDVIATRT
jgi:hypothetical protein